MPPVKANKVSHKNLGLTLRPLFLPMPQMFKKSSKAPRNAVAIRVKIGR